MGAFTSTCLYYRGKKIMLSLSKMFSHYVLQAVLETVAKITHDKSKKNDTQEAKYGNVKRTYDTYYYFCV